MKATLYPLEQKIEAEGRPHEIAMLHGHILDIMSILGPRLKERAEELENGHPGRTPPDSSGEVDRLLDWMIDHGIVPPGNDK